MDENSPSLLAIERIPYHQYLIDLEENKPHAIDIKCQTKYRHGIEYVPKWPGLMRSQDLLKEDILKSYNLVKSGARSYVATTDKYVTAYYLTLLKIPFVVVDQRGLVMTSDIKQECELHKGDGSCAKAMAHNLFNELIDEYDLDDYEDDYKDDYSGIGGDEVGPPRHKQLI